VSERRAERAQKWENEKRQTEAARARASVASTGLPLHCTRVFARALGCLLVFTVYRTYLNTSFARPSRSHQQDSGQRRNGRVVEIDRRRRTGSSWRCRRSGRTADRDGGPARRRRRRRQLRSQERRRRRQQRSSPSCVVVVVMTIAVIFSLTVRIVVVAATVFVHFSLSFSLFLLSSQYVVPASFSLFLSNQIINNTYSLEEQQQQPSQPAAATTDGVYCSYCLCRRRGVIVDRPIVAAAAGTKDSEFGIQRVCTYCIESLQGT